MSASLAIDALGWAAAILLVLAYGLLSTGRLAPRDLAYQLMNLVGALALIVHTWWYGAIPSVAVNVFWAGIAIAALVRRRAA